MSIYVINPLRKSYNALSLHQGSISTYVEISTLTLQSASLMMWLWGLKPETIKSAPVPAEGS